MVNLSVLRRTLGRFRHWSASPCVVCGAHTKPRQHTALWPELREQWRLSDTELAWMDQREGLLCRYCWAPWRVRQLISVFLDSVGACTTLPQFVKSPEAKTLSIAEINALPSAHAILLKLPNLAYSEFGSSEPPVRSEDLMSLSYSNDMFDYVFTSDTLEHVPDFDRALREIRRVLKPGGVHFFTIPVLWDRATRRRAEVVDGETIHHLPPSFHGGPGEGCGDMLVFNEFGGDVVPRIEGAGFSVNLVRAPENPLVATIKAQRIG